MNYDLSLMVTITVTCYLWAPSSGDHSFTCGAISRPPQLFSLHTKLVPLNYHTSHCHSWNLSHVHKKLYILSLLYPTMIFKIVVLHSFCFSILI